MKNLSAFFILLLFSSLSAAENEQEVVEMPTPNPLQLTADWLTYFNVDGEVLEERTEEMKELLDSLLSQMEASDERVEAEKRVTELQTYLDSMTVVESQVVDKHDLTWMPKEIYRLNDYIELSDKIRQLKLEMKRKRADVERFRFTASELLQDLNIAFPSYLSAKPHSKERFINGLQIMNLGIRSLYLQEEAELAQEIISLDQELISRFEAEREVALEKFQPHIDLEKIEGEKREIQKSLDELHGALLALESRSIRSYAEERGGGKGRGFNQQLTNFLLKEAFLKSKLFLAEAKSILYLAMTDPASVQYVEMIEPIKEFRSKTISQIQPWNQMIDAEIDLLSEAFVTINGTTTEEERTEADKKSLELALTHRAYIDALTHQLFYIKLILGLIDQQVVKEQTVSDQISFYFHNLGQWFSDTFGGWLYYSLFDIAGVPVTLMGIIKAILILLASYLLSHLFGRTLQRFTKKKGKLMEPTLYTFQRVFHYLILLAGLLFALASIGLTMRNMAIVLGAVGIGVGFGLQNLVNNFLCGLSLLLDQNIKIGDFVELESGALGRITEVNVQNTTLHTFDGVDVVVPNSSLIASQVVNWTKKDPHQRLHIPFTVAYGTDQEKMTEAVITAALNVSYTMTAKEGVSDPEVWLDSFGDSSLNFELIVWVNIFRSRGRRAMRAQYLTEIVKALKTHDIQIPFPQRDLHLKTIPTEGLSFAKTKDEK